MSIYCIPIQAHSNFVDLSFETTCCQCCDESIHKTFTSIKASIDFLLAITRGQASVTVPGGLTDHARPTWRGDYSIGKKNIEQTLEI